MIREIVLDTETTGLSPQNGDRIVEIACMELEYHIPTGRVYQTYINPMRPMSLEAMKITNLTDDFLKDHPTFDRVVEEFLEFIKDSTLVIHNANFDIRFLNHELGLCEKGDLSHLKVIDTLALAKKTLPGSPGSLDALCRKFGIDKSGRKWHGAMIDVELLAEVYINLLGGKQAQIPFEIAASMHQANNLLAAEYVAPQRAIPLNHQPLPEELEAHQAFISKFKESLWSAYE